MTKKQTSCVSTAQKLNLETARISWQELQKYYAQGLVIIVSQNLDLVQTAALFVDDRGTEVSKLLNDTAVRKAADDDARQWNESGTYFWAVVAAPWVLVQVVT